MNLLLVFLALFAPVFYFVAFPIRRFELVTWLPQWVGVRFTRMPARWYSTYEWSLCLGFWEIRRLTEMEAQERG